VPRTFDLVTFARIGLIFDGNLVWYSSPAQVLRVRRDRAVFALGKVFPFLTFPSGYPPREKHSVASFTVLLRAASSRGYFFRDDRRDFTSGERISTVSVIRR